MQGSIISLDMRNSRGRVDGANPGEQFTIYFSGMPRGIEVGCIVEYEVKISQRTGGRYAKFVRMVAAAEDEDNTVEAPETDVETLPGTDEQVINITIGNRTLPSSSFLTVSQLNNRVVNVISTSPELNNVLVIGEITNFEGVGRTRGHNHYYFGIKDEDNLIACIMYEWDAARGLDFEIENGQQVAIVGAMNFYSKTGKTSLIVKQMINIGEGQAAREREALRRRLREEGLFDDEHKKPIPKHAKKIGILTSSTGRAIGDIQIVAKKKNPYVELYLYHVTVQGIDAVPTVLEGLSVLDAMGLDVIIMGRGGGTLEELDVYNEEAIVRAVYMAQTPILSAVGHADHHPMLENVADGYASTPTQAAEMVIQNVMDDINKLKTLKLGIQNSMKNKLSERKLSLNTELALLAKNNPEVKIRQRRERFDNLVALLPQNIQKVMDAKKYKYDVLVTRLHGLSPTAKLVDGFGYISNKDKPLTSINDVKVDDDIHIIIHDGEVDAKVVNVLNKTIAE